MNQPNKNNHFVQLIFNGQPDTKCTMKFTTNVRNHFHISALDTYYACSKPLICILYVIHT